MIPELAHFAAASRIGVSVTTPELERDIDAQLKALIDEDHPKESVFLARGNSLGNRILPKWVFVEQRPEGTLITTSAVAAVHYRLLDHVTDDYLAVVLGYPESKSSILKIGDGVVVQALDENDSVVFECAASYQLVDNSIIAATKQTPVGGRVHVTTPFFAMSRRIAGMN